MNDPLHSDPFLPPCSKKAGVVLSGIGGWELGLQEAGWDIAFSAELDLDKQRILTRNFNHPVFSSACHAEKLGAVPDGLFVIGGLPEHSCNSPMWTDCMHALAQSKARWVILETVHTVMREHAWPGAIGRIQRDLHDLGYVTLWFMVIYGCKDPVIRWARLMVVGWPMGRSIPIQLSQCHGQAVLMNDIEMGVNSHRGQTYPGHDIPRWMDTIGFPDGWLHEDEPRKDFLTVATIPTVAINIGRMILSADEYTTQLIEQGPAGGDHAV